MPGEKQEMQWSIGHARGDLEGRTGRPNDVNAAEWSKGLVKAEIPGAGYGLLGPNGDPSQPLDHC